MPSLQYVGVGWFLLNMPFLVKTGIIFIINCFCLCFCITLNHLSFFSSFPLACNNACCTFVAQVGSVANLLNTYPRNACLATAAAANSNYYTAANAAAAYALNGQSIIANKSTPKVRIE